MSASIPYTCLTLFSGLGGGALGFARAGFELVGGFDSWNEAIDDYEQLTRSPGHVVDLAALRPDELRARVGPRRPDVLFSSPPCKSFSACLPTERAATAHYRRLSSLAERGIWLALEAWEQPPPIVMLENVPRIQSRGKPWLEAIEGMLRAYGYAVDQDTHDCGELGRLGQSRRRFLIMARHLEQVPEFVYEPPRHELRSCGEVLAELPVPVPPAPDSEATPPGGPMHRLGRLAPLNWLRLALIRAGGDWRDLPARVHMLEPDEVSVGVSERPGRHHGGYGVEAWSRPAHAGLAHPEVANTRASVRDPRLGCRPRALVYGVQPTEEPAYTVLAHARPDNGCWAVADPRVRRPRREGASGVRAWSQPSVAILGHPSHHNGPWQVADVRTSPLEPSHRIVRHEGRWWCLGPEVDLEDKSPVHQVILAADGTWHRPMTTLELAALQGLPVRPQGQWLELAGGSKKRWRQRIGNAVPPPTAEAIARTVLCTLEAAAQGSYLMSGQPIWVERRRAHREDASESDSTGHGQLPQARSFPC